MSVVDAATAEAVARYFLELYPYVYATGDLTEWRALSHPECIFCASVITNIEEMAAVGNTGGGGLVTVHDPLTNQVSARMYDVRLTVDQDAGFEYDPSGNLLDQSDPTTYSMSVVVMHEEGGWSVRGVDASETQ